MFSCDDGYILYGITDDCLCGPDGNWKGYGRPRCIPGEFGTLGGGGGLFTKNFPQITDRLDQ